MDVVIDLGGTLQIASENERKNGTLLRDHAVTLEKRSANLVRVRAKNVGICPPWHIGSEYTGESLGVCRRECRP